MTGGLIGLLESGASGPAFAERLLAAAQAGGIAGGGIAGGGPAIGQHNSQNFWDSFGAVADASNAPHTRGLGGHKPSADANVASGRQVDFYHYYTDPKTKQTSLRLATSISPDELLDHEGDIAASVNVNGFRMAGDDRQEFDRLQSAQLRIDVVQSKSMIPDYLDMMAWMSLAGLFPDKSGKLPPLQDLSFDPSTSSQRMQQMILPGGSGQMAVNLSMAHKDSMFLTVIKTMSNEVGKFSPLLGLPAISVTALKGFCSLYGAIEQRTTFLLNSMPKPTFATQAARAEAQSQQTGLNLVPGDYVLVPNAHSKELTPYLDKLEMRQGYLVPKGSPSTSSVYDLAAALTPDITYLSAAIGLKPAPPMAAPASTPKKSAPTPPPEPDSDTPAPAKKPAAGKGKPGA
jgi:hypothetical protein